MALPQDNLWPVRRDHIQTLIKMLKDNQVVLTGIQAGFATLEENLANKLKEYSEKVTRYAQFFTGIYSELYDSEEYKDADAEVNGLPSDVVLQLVEGLNVNSEGLEVDGANNWVANIYMILKGLELNVSDISDVLSYIQYGMNTWEDAKAITFPDSFPSFDGIVPSGGDDVLSNNLIKDWSLKAASPKATVRACLMAKDADKDYSRKSDLLISITLGEGCPTKLMDVDFPNDEDAVLGIWGGDVITPDGQVIDLSTELREGATLVHIPILVIVKNIVRYGAFIYIDAFGHVRLHMETEDPTGDVQVLAHTTYVAYVNLEERDVDSKEDDIVGFTGDIENDEYYPWVKIYNDVPNDGPDIYTERRLSPDGTPRMLLVEFEAGKKPEFNPLSWVRKKSSFFYRGSYRLGHPLPEDGGYGDAIQRWSCKVYSAFNADIQIGDCSVLGTYWSRVEENKSIQQLEYVLQLTMIRAYTLDKDSSLFINQITVDQFPAEAWNNFEGDELCLGHVVDAAHPEGSLDIVYRKEKLDFLLRNVSRHSVYLPKGLIVSGYSIVDVTKPNAPSYAVNRSDYCNARLTLGETYQGVNAGAQKRTLGVYMNFSPETEIAERFKGARIMQLAHDELNELTTEITPAMAIFPSAKTEPTKVFTGPRHFFNIYLYPNNLVMYEFVFRTVVGWPTDKETILLSKGLLEKDYIPAQNIMMQLGEYSYVTIRSDGSVSIYVTPFDLGHLEARLRFVACYPSIPRIIAANKAVKKTPSAAEPDPNTDSEDYYSDLSDSYDSKMIPWGRGRRKDITPYRETKEKVYYEWKGVNLSNFTEIQEGGIKKFNRAYASKDTSFDINRVDETGEEKVVKKVSDGTSADLMKKELVTDFATTRCYLYTADGNAMKISKIEIKNIDAENTEETKIKPVELNIDGIVGKFPWALTNVDALVANLKAIIDSLESLDDSWENINKLEYFKAIEAHAKALTGHSEQQGQLCAKVVDQAQASSGLGGAIVRGVTGVLKKMDQYAERFKSI